MGCGSSTAAQVPASPAELPASSRQSNSIHPRPAAPNGSEDAEEDGQTPGNPDFDEALDSPTGNTGPASRSRIKKSESKKNQASKSSKRTGIGRFFSTGAESERKEAGKDASSKDVNAGANAGDSPVENGVTEAGQPSPHAAQSNGTASGKDTQNLSARNSVVKSKKKESSARPSPAQSHAVSEHPDANTAAGAGAAIGAAASLAPTSAAAAPASASAALGVNPSIPQSMPTKMNPRQRFELQPGTLGKGHFAKVKKAKDHLTGKMVAIKIIEKKELVKSQAIVKSEIEILKAVGSHPNVVSLIDQFEDHHKFYLVMELCAGGDLFSRIVEHGKFSEVQAVQACKQLALALQHIHRCGVTHRDLKPENVLLQNSSLESPLKIADFGLSKLLRGHQNVMRTVCGCLSEDESVLDWRGNAVPVKDLLSGDKPDINIHTGQWPLLMDQTGKPQSIQRIYRGVSNTFYTIHCGQESSQYKDYTVTPHHEIPMYFAPDSGITMEYQWIPERSVISIQFYDIWLDQHELEIEYTGNNGVNESNTLNQVITAALQAVSWANPVLYGDLIKLTAERLWELPVSIRKHLKPYRLEAQQLQQWTNKVELSMSNGLKSLVSPSIQYHSLITQYPDFIDSCYVYHPESRSFHLLSPSDSLYTLVILPLTHPLSISFDPLTRVLHHLNPSIQSSIGFLFMDIYCPVVPLSSSIHSLIAFASALSVDHIIPCGETLYNAFTAHHDTFPSHSIARSIAFHTGIHRFTTLSNTISSSFTLYFAGDILHSSELRTLYSAVSLAWQDYHAPNHAALYSGLVPSDLLIRPSMARSSSFTAGHCYSALKFTGSMELSRLDSSISRGWVGIVVDDARHNVVLPDGTVTSNTWAYCAPEVILRKPYTEAVDQWTLGVLMFILLSGYHPFDVYGEMPEPELLQKIITCSYDFDDPVWEQCSEEAKDLIRGLIQLDPTKRISLSTFLLSPWITGEKQASNVPLPIVADRLSKFATTRNGFRTLVVAKLASNKFKASLSRSSVNRVASLTQTAQNPNPFGEKSGRGGGLGAVDRDGQENGSDNSLTDDFQSTFAFQSPADTTDSTIGNAARQPLEASVSTKTANSVSGSKNNMQAGAAKKGDQSSSAPPLTITINPDLAQAQPDNRSGSPNDADGLTLSIPGSPSAALGSVSANRLDVEVRDIGPQSGIYIDKNGKQKGGLGNAIPEKEPRESESDSSMTKSLSASVGN